MQCRFTYHIKVPDFTKNGGTIDVREFRDIQDSKRVASVIHKAVENVVIRDLFYKVAYWGKRYVSNQIEALAIFIQRLAARTPMDEDYVFEFYPSSFMIESGAVDEEDLNENNAVEVHHHADENYCRFDWFIAIGSLTFTTGRLAADLGGSDLFRKFNDEDSIKLIKEWITKRLKRMYKPLASAAEALENVSIKNLSDHFDVLEYGGYKSERSISHKGPLYPHGIDKHHSVQAPLGMLRTTLVEWDQIVQSKLVKKGEILANNMYKTQKASKYYSSDEWKQMFKLYKKGRSSAASFFKNFSYNDSGYGED